MKMYEDLKSGCFLERVIFLCTYPFVMAIRIVGFALLGKEESNREVSEEEWNDFP